MIISVAGLRCRSNQWGGRIVAAPSQSERLEWCQCIERISSWRGSVRQE